MYFLTVVFFIPFILDTQKDARIVDFQLLKRSNDVIIVAN